MLRTAFDVSEDGEPSQVVRENLKVITTVADFSPVPADPGMAAERTARRRLAAAL